MEDLGEPASYLTLEEHSPVYSADGKRLGRVGHVLADAEHDIFDGLVIDRSVIPGGHRFVDAEQVEEIFEGGVLLKIDARAAETLPEPSASPARMKVDPTSGGEGPLEEKLRRAWELISGKRFK